MRKFFIMTAVIALLVLSGASASADKPSNMGFSDNGYNSTANIFNGTAWNWCMGKVADEAWCTSYLGPYANDKLIMKWNDEWDRGNDEDWANPPYKAWENNEWNGAFPGGSNSVWHYKIVWVGNCILNPSLVPTGGYCTWGQFATIMDQGVDPTMDPPHLWYALANPAGYGSYP